ncbi:CLUMA_CG018690, isoform A [Clunio marinus]|uniref:CLUMA_CG018690, isoform A n=1 Tax=Clunio marinus TaxID=568069 RepID=A0A1J1J2I6_9DIPT|nr:CLUMA_CG018690, isoform A [Clunio marinus]
MVASPQGFQNDIRGFVPNSRWENEEIYRDCWSWSLMVLLCALLLPSRVSFGEKSEPETLSFFQCSHSTSQGSSQFAPC